eukprot:m.8913 g.8913  ORF g.8913 m.8913 type:complete len:632 (-) comp3368_c0_seq1:78-1973(-)
MTTAVASLVVKRTLRSRLAWALSSAVTKGHVSPPWASARDQQRNKQQQGQAYKCQAPQTRSTGPGLFPSNKLRSAGVGALSVHVGQLTSPDRLGVNLAKQCKSDPGAVDAELDGCQRRLATALLQAGLPPHAATLSLDGPTLLLQTDTGWFANQVLEEVELLGDRYGIPTVGGDRAPRIAVDFSSPNIAKPFHAGHLRSTILGAFVSRLYREMGCQVTRINYLGDWGTQFGLLMRQFSAHGSEDLLAEDPIAHLFDLYVAANREAETDDAVKAEARACFKRLEHNDAEAVALWQRFRELSVTAYKDTYQRLGVEFDLYEGESQAQPLVADIESRLQEQGLASEVDGALVCDLTQQELGHAVVRKSDGTGVYLTRDIVTAIRRHQQLDFDEMIYVVASQQRLHFEQLFHLLEQLGHGWAAKCKHASFGMVKGMSTRKGQVVLLKDLLDEAQTRMLIQMRRDPGKFEAIDNPEAVAEKLGIAAVMVQDQFAKRIKDYTFDWDRMLKSEGSTGPFLLYSYARLCSLERLCPSTMLVEHETECSRLVEPQALALVNMLSMFEDSLEQSASRLDASPLVQYLCDLCKSISSAYEVLSVKKASDPPTAAQRLRLYKAAKQTLGNGLRLLGLHTSDRV